MKKRTLLATLTFSISLGGCVSLITSGYISESDMNGDGSLSFQEYYNSQKPKAGFADRLKSSGMRSEKFAKKEFDGIDVDKNNLINKKELLNYFGY